MIENLENKRFIRRVKNEKYWNTYKASNNNGCNNFINGRRVYDRSKMHKYGL